MTTRSLVTLCLLLAGCSAAGDLEAGVEETTSIETPSTSVSTSSTPGTDGAELIAAFVNEDSQAHMQGDLAHLGATIESGEGGEVAARLAECEALLPAFAALDSADLVELDMSAVDTATAAYRDAWTEKVGLFEANCEVLNDEADALQAEVDEAVAEFGFPQDTSLLAIEIENAVAIENVINACFALQVQLESIDPAPLACAGSDIDEGGDQPDEDSFSGPEFADVDPLAGPTGIENQTLLGPFPSEFTWFSRPFTLTPQTPIGISSTETGFVFFDPGTSAQLEILAVASVADPNDVGEVELRGTVDVPDDLSAWFDAMPLAASGEATEVGGLPATYWVFEFDAATEGNSVALWTSVEPSFGPVIAAVNEAVIHLWHIQHPAGALFVYEIDYGPQGPPLIGQDFIALITF